MKTKTFSAAIFALITSMGVLLPISPAHASASLVSVSDGQILGRGTTVTGTYQVSCVFFGERVQVSWTLRQRAGKSVVESNFNEVFSCPGDGSLLSGTYIFSGGGIFKQGPATITGFILAGDDFDNAEQTAVEVTLRK